MEKKMEFHGSDLEKVAAYYHIPQEQIVCFSANVNPLGVSEKAKDKLIQHLDILSRYPDREYQTLRETIGAYCHTSPEHIIVGNGSTELLSLLISQICAKRALILGPTYSEYAREISLTGGTLTEYHLKEEHNFALDTDDLLLHLTDAYDLLILCNPNNPTSSAILKSDMERILAHCSQNSIFVMVDETYAEFAPSISEITAIPFTKHYQNLMVIRGVSKFFAAPGLRFGYGITGNQTLREQLLTHQDPWSLNSVGAFVGEEMLKDEDYIQQTWNLIDSERTRLYQRLTSFPSIKVYPPYANFILIQILKEDVRSLDVFEAALKEGLMIRDCSSFQSLNGEFIRFCIMKPEDNDRLLECLWKVLE